MGARNKIKDFNQLQHTSTNNRSRFLAGLIFSANFSLLSIIKLPVRQLRQRQNMKKTTRASFIRKTALAAASFYIVPRYVLGGKGYVPPSDKLYIAAVGCGGEAANDIHHYATSPKKNAVIACLCDVDERMAAPRRKEFPKAPFYHDWREMFDKESKNFDAVTVAIPD